MIELLTAAQMRAIEQAAIDSGEVTGLELMERAGRGVVEAIFEEWPELAQTFHRAVVLCGPGNNGGDGFVVARLLKEWGWEVEVFLYGDPQKLPPDARVNHERWCELGEVAVRAINAPPLSDDSLHIPEAFDLLIDGLFGTGLMRPFAGLFTFFAQPQVRSLLRDRGVRVVAVDMPTGLCSDSGRGLGPTISADMTVTFHSAKVGHHLHDGPTACGVLRAKGIGLSETTKGRELPQIGEVVRRRDDQSGRTISKAAIGHKYDHGHALILSGGPGKGGAARLAARGALRIGAGLVTVGCPPEALAETAARLDAIMCRPFAGAEGLTEVLTDDRLNALALGPGLGMGEGTRASVWAALKAERATVLDADALTSFEDDPPALFEFLREDCVLTPHGGEFRRLFPDIAEKLAAPATEGPAYSKVDATREAAARAGCIVLFKGSDTVIADSGGHCSINSAHYDRAAPWLATAGSGDVLTGFIAGLLARGVAAMEAAETAASLHVECARSFGPGLIAEDLPEELPKVFRELGL